MGCEPAPCAGFTEFSSTSPGSACADNAMDNEHTSATRTDGCTMGFGTLVLPLHSSSMRPAGNLGRSHETDSTSCLGRNTDVLDRGAVQCFDDPAIRKATSSTKQRSSIWLQQHAPSP